MKPSVSILWCGFLFVLVNVRVHGELYSEEENNMDLEGDGDNEVKIEVEEVVSRDLRNNRQCGSVESSGDEDCNEFMNNLNQKITKGSQSEDLKSRKIRQAADPAAPIQDFIGTVSPEDFLDIDTIKPIIKWYNEQTPTGYSPNDKKVLLEFDAKKDDYPPFTYQGFNEPRQWHLIDIKSLMLKKNKSFMLLEDTCDKIVDLRLKAARTSVLINDTVGHKARLDTIRRCERDTYSKMYYVCNSKTQSPINIITSEAENSTLPAYSYTNIRDTQGIAFIISVPWDGTDLLTVELKGAVRNPALSLSKIGKEVEDNVEKGNVTFAATPEISLGGLLGSNLFLDRFHIKYGETIDEGSEHQINGKSFSMELQFIFTQFGRSANTQRYWDRLRQDYEEFFNNGRTADLGKFVHIIAVLVEVRKMNDSEFEAYNNGDIWNKKAVETMEILSRAAKKFWSVSNRPNPSTTPNGKPFRYRAFITDPRNVTAQNTLLVQNLVPPRTCPSDANSTVNCTDSPYYSYSGGLTHPPCFDNINWAVYNKSIIINEKIWTRFRYIPSEFDDSGFIAGNFRGIDTIYRRDTDLRFNTREGVTAALAEKRRVRLSSTVDVRGSDYFENDYSGHTLTCSPCNLIIFGLTTFWLFKSFGLI